MNDLLRGELVRLTAHNPETDAEAAARWSANSEFGRLLDSSPYWPMSLREMKDNLAAEPTGFSFMIRVLTDDRLIGFVDQGMAQPQHGETWVAIGIGEPEYWGKGYGTDAMRVALRYGFTELNLYRVSLGVFSYNERALRSYAKAGFKVEGRLRRALHRDGQWWDEINMGVLRSEWGL